ncbi:phage regulatory CII family protein [Pseudomonas sp. DR 5-09]|uniref:phage regulatory CII family protein n=1 Tax=Pseudomonas sp. DR 5-09 TaxID=1534110 RepID=UPI0007DDF921|nr:phage regulatory CII family protein [Pseudomonas sp. DR 5-09]ANI54395.1 regulatory protein [Pseudomonas sp. DR 5-09]
MQELMSAIYDVVDTHGASKIAEGADFTSRTLLSQKANPNYDSHKMNVEELHRVMKFTQDFRPLKAWAEVFGFDLVPKEKPEGINLNAALLRLHADLADVTRLAFDAQADGRVCSVEKTSLLKEAEEVIVSLEVFKQSVKAA